MCVAKEIDWGDEDERHQLGWCLIRDDHRLRLNKGEAATLTEAQKLRNLLAQWRRRQGQNIKVPRSKAKCLDKQISVKDFPNRTVEGHINDGFKCLYRLVLFLLLLGLLLLHNLDVELQLQQQAKRFFK
ncbi:hypothetical protein RJT34_17107 [Clitoria ternatea]|uniref:Uncharacterized protein n=1 Tax=Clitoria ternatea TaxID=43366 RepID=A0AAN9J8C3_CLITE